MISWWCNVIHPPLTSTMACGYFGKPLASATRQLQHTHKCNNLFSEPKNSLDLFAKTLEIQYVFPQSDLSIRRSLRGWTLNTQQHRCIRDMSTQSQQFVTPSVYCRRAAMFCIPFPNSRPKAVFVGNVPVKNKVTKQVLWRWMATSSDTRCSVLLPHWRTHRLWFYCVRDRFSPSV